MSFDAIIISKLMTGERWCRASNLVLREATNSSRQESRVRCAYYRVVWTAGGDGDGDAEEGETGCGSGSYVL